MNKAREGIREHSVGWPPPELAERLERVALRRGIRPRPLDLPPAAAPDPAPGSLR